MKKLGTLLIAGNLVITPPFAKAAEEINTSVYTIITNGETSFMGEGSFTDETGANQECKVYEINGKKFVINIITRPSLLEEGDDELGDMLPEDENTEVFDIDRATLNQILSSPSCKKSQNHIPAHYENQAEGIPTS